MSTHAAKANLRDVLAELYPDEISARLVVAGSGVDARRIEFSSHAIDNWQAILTEAEKVGRVAAVIDIAIHEYGNHNALLKAAIEWQRSIIREAESPAVPTAHMPIEFNWVTIPAGEFLMGSDKQRDDEAPHDELPQHTVYLPEFRISRMPVTNGQYKMFVDATGHRAPEHWAEGMKHDHPVVYVTWDDAQDFCQWAGVRLPTEAEWEKAARGTDGRIYPWGDNPPHDTLCNFGYTKNGTTPVGSYLKGASPYGVLDMAGNVWEWTNSLYWGYPYNASDGREASQIRTARSLRGGYGVRCAARDYSVAAFRSAPYGFRVVVRARNGSIRYRLSKIHSCQA